VTATVSIATLTIPVIRSVMAGGLPR